MHVLLSFVHYIIILLPTAIINFYRLIVCNLFGLIILYFSLFIYHTIIIGKCTVHFSVVFILFPPVYYAICISTAQDLPVVVKALPMEGDKNSDGDLKGNTDPESEDKKKFFLLEFWDSIMQYDEAAEIIVDKEDYVKWGPLAKVMAVIDNYFHITDRGSSVLIEFTGGMTTFLSMSYIMILNGRIYMYFNFMY